MIEVQSTDVDTIANKSIVIETDLGVTVNTATSTVVELIPDSYVLTSLGIFTGNLDGSIPIWLLNAIQQALTTGNGSIASILVDMQLLLDNLSIGVNQNLTHIETTDLSLAALSTSVVSRLDNNDVAILNLDTTRVTTTEAQAISAQVIQSTFNNNIDAYIGSISSTYVDANSAIAQDVSLLAANFNAVSVSIAATDQVVAGYYSEWDGISLPQLGQFKFIGAAQYQFLGGAFGELSDGWVRTDASASVVAGEAATWAASASKLITGPDGSITGWEFADGSNVNSMFKVYADTFTIQGAVNPVDYNNANLVPSINTAQSTANTAYSEAIARVLPAGVANAINTNTTTVNGSKITTGSIAAAQIAASAVTTSHIALGTGIVNGYIQSSDFTTIGGAGFRLKSNAAATEVDPTIYGAYIRAGTLSAARILTGSRFYDATMTNYAPATTIGTFSFGAVDYTTPSVDSAAAIARGVSNAAGLGEKFLVLASSATMLVSLVQSVYHDGTPATTFTLYALVYDSSHVLSSTVQVHTTTAGSTEWETFSVSLSGVVTLSIPQGGYVKFRRTTANHLGTTHASVGTVTCSNI